MFKVLHNLDFDLEENFESKRYLITPKNREKEAFYLVIPRTAGGKNGSPVKTFELSKICVEFGDKGSLWADLFTYYLGEDINTY